MPADPLTIYVPQNALDIKPGSYSLVKLLRANAHRPAVILFLADLIAEFHAYNTPQKVNP